MTIETSGVSGDTVLALFDGNGNMLASDDDGGVDLFSRIDESGLGTKR